MAEEIIENPDAAEVRRMLTAVTDQWATWQMANQMTPVRAYNPVEAGLVLEQLMNNQNNIAVALLCVLDRLEEGGL